MTDKSLAELEFEKSLSKVLNTYEGRHVLMHIMQDGHAFDTSIPFRDNRDFWDGRRSIALSVYDKVLTEGAEVHTMCMKENLERNARYDDRDRNADG